MQSALHITTKVLPGNRVEVQLPSGSEGQEVNVFIVLPTLPLTPSNLAAQLAQMAADSDFPETSEGDITPLQPHRARYLSNTSDRARKNQE